MKNWYTYRNSQVNRHKGVTGYEEVIESNNVCEVIQYMAIPCNEPTEAKDSTNISSAAKGQRLCFICKLLCEKCS